MLYATGLKEQKTSFTAHSYVSWLLLRVSDMFLCWKDTEKP
jgi:hypothetical protein